MKPQGHKDIEEFLKYKGTQRLSAKQINKRWPAFKIPDYIEGVFTSEAGIVAVRIALLSL